jgi:MYXO-CTERM domain-containing protein
MYLGHIPKLALSAGIGLVFSTVAAHAQLVSVNMSEQTTWGPFTGGSNVNTVTNNGSTNTQEVVTSGVSAGTPFSITYNPLSGPSTVSLSNGTLNTSTFVFQAPENAVQYFNTVGITINYDFDGHNADELTQNYTLTLTPFSSPNGLTGTSYLFTPVNSFGVVDFDGQNFEYASVVSNSAGTLFDGSSTTAAIQFQFLGIAVSPVPEPASYALAGVLVLGGIVSLRRRRSSPDAAMLAA